MLIREEIRIKAPLDVVWSVFTCLKDSDKWNSICRAALLKDSPSADACSANPISQGDCISLAIRPMTFPVRIIPRITKFIPQKEVVREGSRFGIRAEHTFTFTQYEGCVVVTSTEKLRGPGLLLSSLVLVPSRLHHLTRQLLIELKRKLNQGRFPVGIPTPESNCFFCLRLLARENLPVPPPRALTHGFSTGVPQGGAPDSTAL